ncbi:hypothetical protein CR513_32248, partial [Mucuna pruriens]
MSSSGEAQIGRSNKVCLNCSSRLTHAASAMSHRFETSRIIASCASTCAGITILVNQSVNLFRKQQIRSWRRELPAESVEEEVEGSEVGLFLAVSAPLLRGLFLAGGGRRSVNAAALALVDEAVVVAELPLVVVFHFKIWRERGTYQI